MVTSYRKDTAWLGKKKHPKKHFLFKQSVTSCSQSKCYHKEGLADPVHLEGTQNPSGFSPSCI